MDILNLLNFLKNSSVEILSEKELFNLFLKKKYLNIKVGFDPTSPNLHLGHVVLLKKLRQFQSFGHKVFVVIGDFTARIGDPSGKKKTRIELDKNTIIYNYSTYKNQILRFLDPNLTKFFFNSLWFNRFNTENFIKLMSFTTVSRLIERTDFKFRFKNEKPININEFIYPLLQAYDSVFLNPDLEIGGVDQKFNLLLSRDIQKKYKKFPQVIMMMPILNGLNGKTKMSKTLNNCVYVTDKPFNIFCKIMSISDELMQDYFVNLGFLSLIEYKKLLLNVTPMNMKLDLAFKTVSLIYNKSLAKKSKVFFTDVFSKKIISNNIESYQIYVNDSEVSISLFSVLNNLNFVKSNSHFKRLLKYNSISVNNILVKDKNFLLFVEKKFFIKIGKKIFFNLFFKNKKKDCLKA